MSDNQYFKKPPVKHFEALAKEQVPQLMAALSKSPVEQQLDIKTVCALKLALYTGLRDNSIRGATWSEIDLAKNIWTVPASRIKSGKEFKLPLPTQAVTVFRTLEPITFKDPTSYVFPSASKYGVLAENTLRLALHRLGFKVTVHGMRSLITNVLNEKGFNRDAIERQLDHQEQNKVRASYLRSDFMDERIQMMQWFADWCADTQTPNNVVTLKRGAA